MLAGLKRRRGKGMSKDWVCCKEIWEGAVGFMEGVWAAVESRVEWRECRGKVDGFGEGRGMFSYTLMAAGLCGMGFWLEWSYTTRFTLRVDPSC